MAAPAGGGGGGGDNTVMTLIFLLLLVMGLLWLFWFFAREYILEVVRYMRLGEMWLLDVFIDSPTLTKAREILPQIPNVREAANGMRLEWPYLASLGNSLGYYYRWVVAVIFAGLGLLVMFRLPKDRFKNRYDMEGLIKIQSQTWPVISPIIDFNPIKLSARIPGDAIPEDLPPFAEALAPEEWLAWQKIGLNGNQLDREGLKRAFVAQLGPRWRGLEGLPVHQRCLLAGFALRGVQKRKDNDIIMGEIAQCWNHKTGFTPTPQLLAKVNKVLRDPKIGGEMLKVARRHAYRTTAILAVLKWAREMGGVLPPASFIWLRGWERALWYPLNNLGRKSYHPEAAGAMAHYMSEVLAGKPLPIPRVDSAMTVIQQWLLDTGTKIPALQPRQSSKLQLLGKALSALPAKS